jgi:hypothetical protein
VPWWKKKQRCLARFTDAVTGRRSADGLGPMGGCVIRLFPKIDKGW